MDKTQFRYWGIALVIFIMIGWGCSEENRPDYSSSRPAARPESPRAYKERTTEGGRAPASASESPAPIRNAAKGAPAVREKSMKTGKSDERILYKSKKKAAKKKGSESGISETQGSPQDVADLVDAALKKLDMGNILFNPPSQMKVGSTERVEVRIGRTDSAALVEGLKGLGKPQIESIRIGTFMQAHLAGKDFEIQTLSQEEQLVTPEGFTEWDWDVMPLRSGEQKLELTVTVRIKLAGLSEEKKDYPVFERLITVKVNPVYSTKKFLRENWQWIITTILGSGIIGWYAKKWSMAKKKRG